MSIDRLTEALGAATAHAPERLVKEAAGDDFSKTLAAARAAVVNPQAEATKAVDSFAHGFDGKLHEMMLAVDKADISMRLLVNVRNKIIDAYREVMRMGA